MKSFENKLAVITGGGNGMGRELARQLAAAGCDVAICDIAVERMTETRDLCIAAAPREIRATAHRCDVADEQQVSALREAILEQHDTDHIDLLFNNAGVAGGGSFVTGDRAEWERTFNICWGGVYNCTRQFLPLLIASKEAVIVNTSSVNGFWASMGPNIPHTAYCTAKFAVKGFSEALMTDLRIHAPHVRVALVMPGHVGTEIVANTFRMHADGDPLYMSEAAVAQFRTNIGRLGLDTASISDDQIRQFLHERAEAFRNDAPLSAAAAAVIILDGVRAGRWRILVGKDAEALDQLVRSDPENAYELSFSERFAALGHFNALMAG